MSEELRAALASDFDDPETADCQVRFCLSADDIRDDDAERDPAAKRPRLSEQQEPGIVSRGVTEGARRCYVGQPLFAHRNVMRLGSARFRAQLRHCWAGKATLLHDATTDPALPTLLVPLSCEADLPAARTAIRYIYTGLLVGEVETVGASRSSSKSSSMTVAELLAVRRQASYLQVGGCVAACDKAAIQVLQHASTTGGGDTKGPGGATCAKTGAADVLLSLFMDPALLPREEEEPESFTAVLVAAKQVLISHFVSALKVLRSAELLGQLVALPVTVLEVLLASDEFATDDESSVLLLLAKWREANLARVTEEELGRLCGLVRVVQLGPAYLHYVLPQLDWFPISRMEHVFALDYAVAPASLRGAMATAAAGVYDLSSPWYSKPRAQALPPGGSTFHWAVSRQELLDALATMERDRAVSSCGTSAVLARGFRWTVLVHLHPAGSAYYASVGLKCGVPSELGELAKVGGTAVPYAAVEVHRWRQDLFREVAHLEVFEGSTGNVTFNDELVRCTALRLKTTSPEDGAAAAAAADPLWRWSEYMHDDGLEGIGGSITYLAAADGGREAQERKGQRRRVLVMLNEDDEDN